MSPLKDIAGFKIEETESRHTIADNSGRNSEVTGHGLRLIFPDTFIDIQPASLETDLQGGMKGSASMRGKGMSSDYQLNYLDGCFTKIESCTGNMKSLESTFIKILTDEINQLEPVSVDD